MSTVAIVGGCGANGMTQTQPDDDNSATTWQRDNERLRRAYLELHDDLLHRDREAQRDPKALQRWPMERKAYADRVDGARQEWESHDHRRPVDGEGRSGDRSDPEHDTRDEQP